MVKHVLLCKLKEATPESIGQLVGAIEGLRDTIECLRSLEVGVDFKRSPVSYDVVALAVFDDRDGLARFSAHPRHKAVVELVRAACSAISIVDYELA